MVRRSWQTENPEIYALLKEEWSYKNDKELEDYGPGSKLRPWWRCLFCGYEWQTRISHRARGTGCPYCVKPDFMKNSFDETKYVLGKICLRGHDWNNTGKSLRVIREIRDGKKLGGSCSRCSWEIRNGIDERKTNIWSLEKIIEEIQKRKKKNLYLNDRIIHVQDNPLYIAARKEFGSWGNAVEAAGICYNEILGISKYIALNGEAYDSYEEAICANILYFLLLNGLIKSFESHVRISNDRQWTCDFVVVLNDGTVIHHEYDGCRKMKLSSKRVAKYLLEKEEYYRTNNFNFESSRTVEEFANFYDFEIREEIYEVKSLKQEEMKKEIIEDFSKVIEILGKIPTGKEYSKFGKYSHATIARKFNGYKNFKENFDTIKEEYEYK